MIPSALKFSLRTPFFKKNHLPLEPRLQFLLRRNFASASGQETLSEDKGPVEQLFGMEPKIQKIRKEGSDEPKNAREDPAGGMKTQELKKSVISEFSDIQDMRARIKDAQKPDARGQTAKPPREVLEKDMRERGELDNYDLDSFKEEAEGFGGQTKVSDVQPKYTESNQATAEKSYKESLDGFQKELAEDQKAGRIAYENSEYAKNKYNPDYFQERKERGELGPHIQGRQSATGEPLEVAAGTIPPELRTPGRDGVSFNKLTMEEIDERKQKYSGIKIPEPANASTPRASPPISNAELRDDVRATNADLERTAFDSAAAFKEGIGSAVGSMKEGAKKLGEKIMESE